MSMSVWILPGTITQITNTKQQILECFFYVFVWIVVIWQHPEVIHEITVQVPIMMLTGNISWGTLAMGPFNSGWGLVMWEYPSKGLCSGLQILQIRYSYISATGGSTMASNGVKLSKYHGPAWQSWPRLLVFHVQRIISSYLQPLLKLQNRTLLLLKCTSNPL